VDSLSEDPEDWCVEPEAHLVVDQGPRAGTIFVLAQGERKVFGCERPADFRLPGLALKQAFVRFAQDLEILVFGETADETATWTILRPGETVNIGPYVLRAELFGLSATAIFTRLSTRRLEPSEPPEGFVIEGRLGSGGFGTVYSARREGSDELLAIKILHDQPTQNLVERFKREAAAASTFRHPNVVQIRELGLEHDPPYVTMELIHGPNLADLAATGIPARRAMHLGVGVANALSAIAQAGFVHRDVKPQNVLVAPGDHAKLADFGLVKDLQGRYATLTRTGTAMGTFAYVPPEQLRDAKRVTPAADVYGLAAMLFHLIQGRLPFEMNSASDVQLVLEAPPPWIDNEACPASIRDLLHACLSKDPLQRPSAAEVARQLVLASS
jgi:serine/threonine protein kinase